jgi:hypothetical protein
LQLEKDPVIGQTEITSNIYTPNPKHVFKHWIGFINRNDPNMWASGFSTSTPTHLTSTPAYEGEPQGPRCEIRQGSVERHPNLIPEVLREHPAAKFLGHQHVTLLCEFLPMLIEIFTEN